ncbi:MAG: MATE family efflux transporter [Sphingomonadaceae bacterium]
MSDEPEQTGARNAKLTGGSIGGHLVAQTAPMIVGVGALMSVGIIDAYFIGRLGAAQLAAVAFIFPVTTALSSLGVGIMAGLASVVSRALGRGEDDHARGLANLGIVLSLAVGMLFAVPLYLLRGSLFRLMQADSALLPLIDVYMQPFAFAFAVLPGMMAINAVLRAQGAAKRSMAVLLTMAATNWVLDPILIVGGFGFEGFGIAGAAYATLASWTIAAVLGIALVQTTVVKVELGAIRHCIVKRDSLAIARVAGPAAFSNAINPAGLAVLTALLASAGPAAVAGFGAGGRLQAFAVVPLLGLSGSIGAIVGQNWGAQRFGRARRALYWAGGFSLVYGLAVAALMVIFRDALAALFTDDAEVRATLARYISISAWGYGGYGLCIIVNGALNAVDRAGMALAQSLARIALVMVPVAWLARPMLGADAVYFGELAANIAGAVIAVLLVRHVLRKANESGA